MFRKLLFRFALVVLAASALPFSVVAAEISAEFPDYSQFLGMEKSTRELFGEKMEMEILNDNHISFVLKEIRQGIAD